MRLLLIHLSTEGGSQATHSKVMKISFDYGLMEFRRTPEAMRSYASGRHADQETGIASSFLARTSDVIIGNTYLVCGCLMSCPEPTLARIQVVAVIDRGHGGHVLRGGMAALAAYAAISSIVG